MVYMIKPYTTGSSMGEDLFGLGGLADAFFGPKASQSAYTREKFKEQQRQNIGTDELATLLATPGADPGAMAAAAARGGVTSSNLGGYNQFTTVGRAPDIRDPSVARSVLQAGGNYASTPVAFDAAQANELKKQEIASTRAANAAIATADNTPISVRMPTPENPNNVIITSRSDAIKRGLQPVLSATEAEGTIRLGGFPTAFKDYNQPQLAAAGVDTKEGNVFNWSAIGPDGKPIGGFTVDRQTDAITKQPLPAGVQLYSPGSAGAAAAATGTTPGKTEQKDRREAVINADQVLNLGTKITDIVKRNPTAIGAVGNLRAMGQEGADLLDSLNLQFGGGKPGGYDAAVSQARNQLRAKLGAGAAALLPELFDSDLNSVRTMNGMMVYKAAAALGQSGRDASDKDIATVKGLTGDPSSWFQGPRTYMDKINTLTQIIAQQRDDDYKLLQPGATIQPRAGAVPPTATTPPPGGALPGGTTSTGRTWTVEP